jgi:hypothetical protein
MLAISQEIRGRTFDSQGLSQGMPFIYRNRKFLEIDYEEDANGNS